MTRNTSFIGLAVAATLTTPIGSAATVDYSPAGCAAGAGRSADLITTRFGEAFNKNTGAALDVLCPVALHAIASNVDVQLILKKATAATVNCFVHARFDDGSGGTVKTGSASGSGTKLVYIAAVPHYSVVTAGCQLPAAASATAAGRTGIVSYLANEY